MAKGRGLEATAGEPRQEERGCAVEGAALLAVWGQCQPAAAGRAGAQGAPDTPQPLTGACCRDKVLPGARPGCE